jgi:hypothetical protein
MERRFTISAVGHNRGASHAKVSSKVFQQAIRDTCIGLHLMFDCTDGLDAEPANLCAHQSHLNKPTITKGKAGFKTIAESGRATDGLNGPGAVTAPGPSTLLTKIVSSGWSFGRHIPEAQDRLLWTVIVPKGVKSVSIEAFAEQYRDHGFFVVDDEIDVSSGSQELHLSQAAIAVISWLGLDET